MTTTTVLKIGTSLTVTCGNGDLASIRRLSNGDARDNSFNSPLTNVNLNYGCSLKLGPFVEERYYQITPNGSPTYSVVPEILAHNHNSTGAYSGGALSINQTTTKFNISAGSGIIVDNYTDIENPTSIRIDWPAISGVTATYIGDTFTSYVAVDAGGNVVQFSGTVDANNRRDYILLGLLIHTGNTVIESVSNFAVPGYDQANSMNDIAFAIGLINIDGNEFSANGANLKLNKSIGTGFRIGGNIQNSAKSPNVVTSDNLPAPPLFKPYKDGAGGYLIDFPLVDTLDPTKWDDGSGTLATVAASDPWQVVRIYADLVNDDVIAHYGQAVYKNAFDAEYSIPGEDFDPNPVLKDALLRCFLIIKYDCTSLQDTTKCKFISADKFGQSPARGSTTNVPVFQGTTAERPVSASTGQIFYDTTLGLPIWWDGANWKNAQGTIV